MISLFERQQARLALRRLTDLQEQLETALARQQRLPDDLSAALRLLTNTSDVAAQLRAIVDLQEQTDKEYREKLLAAAPTSLSCFAEFMFPEEPPAAHHEFMCEKLEDMDNREIMRMMISMAPGHAKSRYCSILFPSWYMGRHPKHKYIQGGYGQEFVEKNFGMKVKGIIEAPDYSLVFPGLAINNDLKANGYWGLVSTAEKTKGRPLGEYVTRGVGQGIAGFRANCAGVDDPYATRKDAESPAKRKEVYEWFQSDFTPRLLPKSPMFIVATRWTTQDLCATIEEWNKKGIGMPWEIINLPAISLGENDPMGRPEGEALWPDFYTLDHLLNLKATLPPRDWNSLFMGNPVDEAGGAITGSMLHHYEQDPPEAQIRRKVMSVDCANKDNQRADYTVCTVWAETYDRRHHLMHVVRKRVEFVAMVKLIEETARAHQVSAILVEDKGSGTQYIQSRAHLAPAPVISINVGNASKEFRFDGVVPMFEAGEVLLPRVAGWLPDYVRELLTFPDATHDDQVDSTSQYLHWARRGRTGGTKKMVGLANVSQAAVREALEAGRGPLQTVNRIG